MNSRVEIPDLADRAGAYGTLHDRATRINEAQVVTFAHWSRFDPRLGEILVARLATEWVHLNPLALNTLAIQSAWPQSLAVIIDHVNTLVPSIRFKLFRDLVVHEIGPAPFQAFGIGLFQPGGRRQRQCAERPLRLFSKWGYYESHMLFHNAGKTKKKTSLAPEVRRQILKNLLKSGRLVSVTDYIAACDGNLHRRQAERDLKTFFKLKITGQTQSRRYRK